MKLGKTWRKIKCCACGAHVAWMPDVIIESDWKGGLAIQIFCEKCKNEKVGGN